MPRPARPRLAAVLALVLAGGAAMAADPPGVTRPPELSARLEAAYAAKGPGYVPRTELHAPDGQARYVNRLIFEASPYLLQHAHNPVDWHAWGDEALTRAEAEGKPIFLSVGYATCHWCHVMEEESFDDEEVAAVLNAHFIAIKLDREQRPDLDQIYITATQLQNGHAGWPNSVFLKPDGAPFHTGTYFPKPHFLRLLATVAEAWQNPEARTEIERVSGQLSDAINRQAAARLAPSPPPGPQAFSTAVDQLSQMHNSLEGGFSQAQQFPQETFLLFLLDHWRRTGDAAAKAIATGTLDAIAAGGLHDHAGGGFHRYTVDPNWRTPHFEKMLYNQGLLVRAFVEGWEATREPAYARAVARAIDYVARDITDEDGAFYSAEDADSLSAAGEREEGAFYVWTPETFEAALGEAEAARVGPMLGMDTAPTLDGQTVLHLPVGEPADFAALDPALETLRLAREARPRPIRDEKIIAGWNGLMIRAMAEAAHAFARPDWAERAARAGDTLWDRLWDGTRLHRLWAEGRAMEAGQLEDYAFLGLAYLALHEATGEPRWAERAADLTRALAEVFGDGTGRLKMAAADGPIGPVYDSSDGATPTGESAALELLARIGPIAADADLTIRAEELRAALSGQLTGMPLLRAEALVASRILDEGRSTLRRHLAGGVLGVHLLRADAGSGGWRLHLAVAPGWHLNAHAPGPDWLIGASVDGAVADWPEGTKRRLGFAEEEVRVYEGQLDIPLSPQGTLFRLKLQACSDAVCLDPVDATFRLP